MWQQQRQQWQRRPSTAHASVGMDASGSKLPLCITYARAWQRQPLQLQRSAMQAFATRHQQRHRHVQEKPRAVLTRLLLCEGMITHNIFLVRTEAACVSCTRSMHCPATVRVLDICPAGLGQHKDLTGGMQPQLDCWAVQYCLSSIEALTET